MPIRFLRFAIIWLLVLATFWVMEPYLSALWFSSSAPRTVTPRGNLAASEQATIELFKNASPSVVHVFARATPTISLFSDEEESVVQSGSGIIWDLAGHVITNNHVINGTAEIGVRLTSGEFVTARVVGAAPSYDLAVSPTGAAKIHLAPACSWPVRRSAGGTECIRDRQPLRPRPDPDLRDRKRARPKTADGQCARGQRHDSDRCADQSG